MKKFLFLIAAVTGMGVAMAQQEKGQTFKQESPKQEQIKIKVNTGNITKQDIKEPVKQKPIVIREQQQEHQGANHKTLKKGDKNYKDKCPKNDRKDGKDKKDTEVRTTRR